MGKNMQQLAMVLIRGESLQYNESGKQMFKTIGKKAMRELAVLLELKEYDISFNPGGIAVSGDLHLMGMWSEENGVYILINKDFVGCAWGEGYYRTIKHMRDFTGGPNHWLPYKELQFPVVLKERIMQLRIPLDRRDADGHVSSRSEASVSAKTS